MMLARIGAAAFFILSGTAVHAQSDPTQIEAGLFMYDCLEGDPDACEVIAKVGSFAFWGHLDEGGPLGDAPHFEDVVLASIGSRRDDLIAEARATCAAGDAVACTHAGNLLDMGLDKPTMDSFGLFAAACDGGHASGCSHIATISDWSNARADQSDALAFYQDQAAACDGGDMTACLTQARLNTRLKEVTRNRDIWFDQMTAGCDQNMARACRYLGDAYGIWGGIEYEELHTGVSALLRSPLKQSIVFNEKACSLGEPVACANLGAAYSLGDGVSEDDAKGRVYDRRACKMDGWSGCHTLTDDPWWVQDQSPEALDAACRDGDFVACHELADPNDIKALTDICKAGSALACADVAAIFDANGDRTAAARFAFVACDNRIGQGCILIGDTILRDGSGSQDDFARAIAYFALACEDQYSAQGCIRAGQLYEKGTPFDPPDLERAEEFYRFACNDSGSQEACDLWDQLPN